MDYECALWSCTEAAGHSQALDALAQEEGNVGVVIVGGMYDRLEIVVANKCLTSRAVERACGVPLLPAASLETSPWHLSDTFFNRLLQDGEAARHWLFYAPTLNTAAFRSVWLYYESKLVPGYPGMNKTVYYLQKLQKSKSQGMFRLTKYPVPGIQPEAFYVLFFKPTTPGNGGVFGGEGKSTEVSANKNIQPSKTGDDLTLDNRAITVEADAARQIVGSTSLPSEDPVSEQVLRNLEYLEVKDELIKKEEVLTRIKDAKGGEEDKVLQELMTIPSARARVLLQQDTLCKLIRALGVLTSASKVVDYVVSAYLWNRWMLPQMHTKRSTLGSCRKRCK